MSGGSLAEIFQLRELSERSRELSWGMRMCPIGGSSGLVRVLRCKAKPGHKRTLGARRAPNVRLCPGFV